VHSISPNLDVTIGNGRCTGAVDRRLTAGVASDGRVFVEKIMSVADELVATVDAAVARLGRRNDAEASVRPGVDRWSPKEVIGHLIDSAANNLHRFVRAQEVPMLEFPGYAQDHWVGSQGYQLRDWRQLLSFWQAFNHHLAHVIRRLPEDALARPCRIGDGAPVSLQFLVEDYLAHLKHHLVQVDHRLAPS
jgi:hypothetical protein